MCGEKGTPLYYWWECKFIQPLWKTVCRLLKLKIQLQYDLAIPCLEKTTVISRKKLYFKKIMHIPMLVAPLSTIAKTWEKPVCPLPDEWVKKLWYIYTVEAQSAVKKSKMMSFAATWMDLEIIILSEVKSQRERQIPYDILICGV